jgi:hypothetical protein
MAAGATPAVERVPQALGGLTLLAAAYLTVLVALYFFPPHVPRHQLESAFFVLVGLGVATAIARGSSDARVQGRAYIRGAAAFSLAAAFTGLAFAIYHQALGLGFLSDDFVVADFARRRAWVYGTDAAFARPLVPLLWTALEYVPARFDKVVHATNILLHALNGSLVVLLAARMGLSRLQAIAAGLLFIASPALSEAVVWSTGVHDVLMTTFCLMAVLAATTETAGARALILAAVATVLALAAKETAVVVPALAALAMWASGLRITDPARVRMLGALAAICAVYAAFRLSVGVPATYGEDIVRLYFVKQLIVGPFAALGAPWTVPWVASHPVAALVRSLAVLALVTGGLLTWRRNSPDFKRAAACAAWVFIAILPVFSLFYIGPSLEGSRYLYLSAAGFAIMVAVLAGNFAAAHPRPPAPVLFVAVLLAATAPTIPALSHEIRRWSEAARVRDAILARAREDRSLASCRSFVTAGQADNVDGAYVFRNGLVQALAAERSPGMRGLEPGRACRLVWNGEDLSVAPE